MFNYLMSGLTRLGPLVLAFIVSACGVFGDTSAEDAQEALALIEQRRIAEARMAIADAIAQKDDEPDYHLIRAQIEMTAGASVNAFSAFNNALALDPTNRDALTGVARLGLEVGRISESQTAVEQLLLLEPRNEDALVIRGFLHFVRSDYEEALEYAQRLRESAPDNEAGVILGARSNFLLGNEEEALAALARHEEANGVTQGTARTRLEIGRYNNDADAMENAFEFLLAQLPDDLLLKVDHANFLFKRGDVPAATKQVVAVLTSDDAGTTLTDAVLDVVREYDGEPALAEAIGSARASLGPSSKVKLARTFIDARLFDAASAMLDDLRTNDAEALRGWLAYHRGRMDTARNLANAVLKNDADNCMALVVAARVALRQQDHSDAIRHGQRSASQCAEEEEAWKVTALAYAAKGDSANARRVFRQGVDAMPQNSRMTAAYTSWLLRSDAQREAIAAGRRLTQRAPALLSGWRLYQRVCKAAGAPCVEQAEQGLAVARSAYGIDLAPGERTNNGLFGRFTRR